MASVSALRSKAAELNAGFSTAASKTPNIGYVSVQVGLSTCCKDTRGGGALNSWLKMHHTPFVPMLTTGHWFFHARLLSAPAFDPSSLGCRTLAACSRHCCQEAAGTLSVSS